jgi:hypothetical protein
VGRVWWGSWLLYWNQQRKYGLQIKRKSVLVMNSLLPVADLARCLLKLMQENATLNVETPNIHIGVYDWGELPSEIPVSDADVILAADCVYFEVRSALVYYIET